MAAAAGDAGKTDVAGKLGIEPGMVVQELGWDSDIDDEVRNAVEERCGDELRQRSPTSELRRRLTHASPPRSHPTAPAPPGP